MDKQGAFEWKRFQPLASILRSVFQIDANDAAGNIVVRRGAFPLEKGRIKRKSVG